jgi:hypothetical protein
MISISVLLLIVLYQKHTALLWCFMQLEKKEGYSCITLPFQLVTTFTLPFLPLSITEGHMHLPLSTAALVLSISGFLAEIWTI